MAIAFKNSVAVVADYSKKWAIACRAMLEVKRPRVSIRAKWKKVGGGWQVVSATKKTFRGNYVASGELVNSIQADPNGLTLGITMNKTADYVQKGRKPGKGIPLDAMRNWTKMKRIQPRDMGTGRFKGKADKNAMRFMMNRKIKYFGITPFPFVTEARQQILPSFNKALTKAMKQDIQKRTIQKMSFTFTQQPASIVGANSPIIYQAFDTVNYSTANYTICI